eukprot:909824-Prymnesium_polylepis.1
MSLPSTRSECGAVLSSFQPLPRSSISPRYFAASLMTRYETPRMRMAAFPPRLSKMSRGSMAAALAQKALRSASVRLPP